MSGPAWLREAIDLVLPVRCLGCGRRATAWCDACVRDCLDPRVRPLAGGLLAAAATSYQGAARDAVLGYKDRGRRDLLPPLGWLLAAAVDGAAVGLREPLVVPMPSSARAARRRGGDHMVRLAGEIAGSRPVAIALGSRDGADAAALSAAGRQIARSQAMYARRGADDLVRGRDILLVDDIVTTGATLQRAGEIVRALGARRVHAAVVAETERQVARR